MMSTVFFVQELLKQMCGRRVENLQCVAITDCQDLFSNIHHLKSNTEDYRLQADIINIRQNIEEKTVQEVRYCHTSQNIADSLTKASKSGEMLLSVIRSGYYEVPGGTEVRDSTKTAVRTWNQLMSAERLANLHHSSSV